MGGALLAILCSASASASTFVDPTFGDRGVARVGKAGYPEDMLVQPDGRILIAGTRYESIGGGHIDSTCLIARLTANGKPDPTFSRDGLARFPDPLCPKEIALEPDGSIIGAWKKLVRITPGGRLDHTFGDDGRAPLPRAVRFPDGLTTLPDGRIALAAPTGPFDPVYEMSQPLFAVAQFSPEGSLDPSFSEDGIATVAIDPEGTIADLLYTDFGQLVIVGTNEHEQVVLTAFASNGDLDPRFGGAGVATGPSCDSPAPTVCMFASAATTSGDRLAVGGVYAEADSLTANRYVLPIGQPDPTFSFDGQAVTPAFPAANHHYLYKPLFAATAAIAEDSQGRLWLGGWSHPGGAQAVAWTFVRYLPDGQPDTALGPDGILVSRRFGGGNAGGSVRGLAPQGRKMIAVGWTDSPPSPCCRNGMVVVRLR
jgi:uncharacterized delta-60 repeat protein